MLHFNILFTGGGFGILSLFFGFGLRILIEPFLAGMTILWFDKLQIGYVIRQDNRYLKVTDLGVLCVHVEDITAIMNEMEKTIYDEYQPTKKRININEPVLNYHNRDNSDGIVKVNIKENFFDSLPLYQELSIPNSQFSMNITSYILSRK